MLKVLISLDQHATRISPEQQLWSPVVTVVHIHCAHSYYLRGLVMTSKKRKELQDSAIHRGRSAFSHSVKAAGEITE